MKVIPVSKLRVRATHLFLLLTLVIVESLAETALPANVPDIVIGDAMQQKASAGRPAGAEPKENGLQIAATAHSDSDFAEAISRGEILIGMSTDEVVQSLGEPLRKEVIPPDAELWQYPRGEVAFSTGVVSYVGLQVQRRTVGAATSGHVRGDATVADTTVRRSNTDTRRYAVRKTSDGFVAVRSQPTVQAGRRVKKLRYGDVVNCDRTQAGQRLWAGSEWLHCPDAGGWIYGALLERR